MSLFLLGRLVLATKQYQLYYVSLSRVGHCWEEVVPVLVDGATSCLVGYGRSSSWNSLSSGFSVGTLLPLEICSLPCNGCGPLVNFVVIWLSGRGRCWFLQVLSVVTVAGLPPSLHCLASLLVCAHWTLELFYHLLWMAGDGGVVITFANFFCPAFISLASSCGLLVSAVFSFFTVNLLDCLIHVPWPSTGWLTSLGL